MSKKRPADKPVPPAPPAVVTRFAPSPVSLAALTVLGTIAALWALFLWGELVASRLGGAPVCALGDATSCMAIWDSPFASAVHRLSGVPVAGWGLAWGIVAFLLPLLALLRTAEAQPEPALVSAIRLTGAAGLASVFVLVAVSAAAGAFCLGCAGTYLVVGGYAGIALFGWPGAGLPDATRGAAFAGTAALVAFLLLLYPGRRTPGPQGEEGREAVAAVGQSFTGGPGTGDADRDQRLAELVSSLTPAQKQTLADSLFLYRQGPDAPPPPARRLDGPQGAPVLITEWTDVLCGHCADLHRTLTLLREHVPPDSFSVDARQFPLDAECNPFVQRKDSPVRCLAARAQICLEGHEKEREFVAELFESQADLTPEKLYAVASSYVTRSDLETCVASAATARKLSEDVEAASRYDPDGTPIVAVNGRRGTSFAPFLFAVVLTGGADAHPAFAGLPAPNPEAHLH